MEGKYYSEDQLVEMYQEGKISKVEYVLLHSIEWEDDFRKFCKEKGLEICDESADMFLDRLDEEFENGDV